MIEFCMGFMQALQGKMTGMFIHFIPHREIHVYEQNMGNAIFTLGNVLLVYQLKDSIINVSLYFSFECEKGGGHLEVLTRKHIFCLWVKVSVSGYRSGDTTDGPFWCVRTRNLILAHPAAKRLSVDLAGHKSPFVPT